jgi:adenosine deaminase
MADGRLDAWLENLPKVELHIHIEGSLEPELMFALAKRNHIPIPFQSVQEVRAAYRFSNLQSFLDIYYQGMNVLRTEDDFYDLTKDYFDRCVEDHVRHCEIFFDPQGHTSRGVPLEVCVKGIRRGMRDAQDKHGITSYLILSFLRHLSEDDAMRTLEEAIPFRGEIIGVGLDSSEVGHPPSKFVNVFARAKALGWRLCAHAGEEGPPQYIVEALDLLHVHRIDHGVRCLEDSACVERLKRDRIPLTTCPLSNLKLRVFTTMEENNLPQLLAHGLVATINSDDPAYFGGYQSANFKAMARVPGMDREKFEQAARNGIEATFLDAVGKRRLIDELEEYLASSWQQQ